ncbi:MAG: prepilin-type N-terminal cleavage/methylation domain-containing protein [Deltaproteobacteria bacterium]|nr:prepilin-type N-terminal cleavage/methylation domain-containing protein [Deltaproteobacteria bacterium]
MKKCSSDSAFTLVELIVVVAIMAMGMSLFLGINYRQRETFNWRSNLRELHVFLKAARSYAVLERRTNICRYSSEQHSFSESLRGKRVKLTDGVEFILAEEQQAQLDSGVGARAATEVDVGREKAQIDMVAFYADGGAAGGPLEIHGGRRTAFLEIDPLTGEVRIEERVSDDAGKR